MIFSFIRLPDLKLWYDQPQPRLPSIILKRGIFERRHSKRVLRVIWISNMPRYVYFALFKIILKLFCENISRKAVKISFLNLVYKQHCYLQRVSCGKILLLSWTWYESPIDYLVLILKFYAVPVCLHDVTNFLNQQTRVDIFAAKVWRYFLIMSQLR